MADVSGVCIMSITLHVDPETERLARQIAEATGQPVPAVVKSALDAMAEHLDLNPSPAGRTYAFNDDLDLDYFDDGPAQ